MNGKPNVYHRLRGIRHRLVNAFTLAHDIATRTPSCTVHTAHTLFVSIVPKQYKWIFMVAHDHHEHHENMHSALTSPQLSQNSCKIHRRNDRRTRRNIYIDIEAINGMHDKINKINKWNYRQCTRAQEHNAVAAHADAIPFYYAVFYGTSLCSFVHAKLNSEWISYSRLLLDYEIICSSIL